MNGLWLTKKIRHSKCAHMSHLVMTYDNLALNQYFIKIDKVGWKKMMGGLDLPTPACAG